MVVCNRYTTKKNLLFFAYKQFDMRDPLLPTTSAPGSRAAITAALPRRGHPHLGVSPQTCQLDAFPVANRQGGFTDRGFPAVCSELRI